MDAEKCTYQVFWSEEDREYVATVLEDAEESGEAIPVPLGCGPTPESFR